MSDETEVISSCSPPALAAGGLYFGPPAAAAESLASIFLQHQETWFLAAAMLDHLDLYAQQMSGKALPTIQDLIPPTPLKKGGLKVPPPF
jgi:hypothetical protein